MRAAGRPRASKRYVERLSDSLSERDRAIVRTVDRVRLVTGLQIERLHFHDLSTRSRSVMRWRVLKRLTDTHILITLDRRLGAARRSGQLRYTLDSAGKRLAQAEANLWADGARIRRPRLPGERFVAHALAVSELYVSLVELSRLGRFEVADFQVEPAWPSGLSGWLRPDALVQLRRGTDADYWWYEADLATEAPTTVRGKLLAYLDFVTRGQLGPDGIVPRVCIGVPTKERQAVVQALVNALPPPAELMFVVALLSGVPTVMQAELMAS